MRVPRRGSILDLFLIFLFVLCLLGVFFRWYELHGQQSSVELQELSVYAVLPDIDPRVAGSLEVGEALYNASGEYFGRVLEVKLLPARVTMLHEGKHYSGTWDEGVRGTLELRIGFSGSKTQGRVLWHGTRELLVGERIELFGARTGFCLTLRNFPEIQTE